MDIFIWLLVVLTPIFIITATRTKLINKISWKILVTIAATIWLIRLIAAALKVTEQEDLIVTMSNINQDYYYCMYNNLEQENKDWFFDCIEKHNDLIFEVYWD